MNTRPKNALGPDRGPLLVIKPSSLGDVIHTLPAVADLARARPDQPIHWLVNREWAPLLAGHPALDSVIEFPRRELRGYRPSSLRAARQWARDHLGGLRPELAIDFQGLLRSALLGRASGAGHLVGFSRSREAASMFYDERVDIHDWDRLHAVERYRRLVAAALEPSASRPGSASTGKVDQPEFTLPAGAPLTPGLLPDEQSDRLVQGAGPVVLHPFSRGLIKSLSAAEVRQFCERLAPVPVVIVGSERREFSPPLPENAIDLLARTTLSQLIGVLRTARFTVSVDSGPMHMAAALSDRLLAIHTWSNPRVVGPCRPAAWVWRDSWLGRVSELGSQDFPEHRPPKGLLAMGRKKTAAGGANDLDPDLLPPGALESIAERVRIEISFP